MRQRRSMNGYMFFSHSIVLVMKSASYKGPIIPAEQPLLRKRNKARTILSLLSTRQFYGNRYSFLQVTASFF